MKIRKVKWKNLILLILFFLFLGLLLLSAIKMLQWYMDAKKTANLTQQILEKTKIQEVEDTFSTEIIETNSDDVTNPYWDYIKMQLMDVDFKYLKEQNASTMGWLQVPGTQIHYPFVQTTNNDYYLNHSFNQSYNQAGWIFMDYRNSIQTLDKNTIIYGHGRSDKAMFGTLKNVLTEDWLHNTNYHIIKMSTETENTLWQIFSVYHIETTSDYLQTHFRSDEEFMHFSQTLLKRSSYDFKTSISEKDKLLTLSTCYNDKEKMVLHAKLIKVQKK